MKDFLKNVLEGTGISPSVKCQESFSENFKDAINVEWHKTESSYEAIFYMHKREHIALFSFDGMLMEYRKMLPSEFLPEAIKNLALSKGEIMNAVMKNTGNTLEYELIVRDEALQRHMLLISDVGELKEEGIL